MTKVERTIESEKTLEEKCRVALEKSYGMPIPMPKYVGKRQSRFWIKRGMKC